GESGTVRPEREAAIAAGDLDRLGHRKPFDRDVEALESRGVKETDERERRAVHDRNFGSVELDRAVVQPLSVGGGENVLDGSDRNPTRGESRGVVERAGRVDAGGDARAAAVHPAEDDPVARRSGAKACAHRVAGVETDSLDGDAR